MSVYGEWNYGKAAYSTADVSPSVAATSAGGASTAIAYRVRIAGGASSASASAATSWIRIRGNSAAATGAGALSASNIVLRNTSAALTGTSSINVTALGFVYVMSASMSGASASVANATATYSDPATFTASSGASVNYIRVRNTSGETISVGSVVTVGREKWEAISPVVVNWSSASASAFTWTKITDGVTL